MELETEQEVVLHAVRGVGAGMAVGEGKEMHRLLIILHT